MASSMPAAQSFASAANTSSPGYATLNPSSREFAPSRSTPASGRIASRRPITPPMSFTLSQLQQQHDLFSTGLLSPPTPADDFDERQAIPSSLLDSPVPARRVFDNEQYKYRAAPLLDLHHGQHEIPAASLERHPSLSSSQRAKEYGNESTSIFSPHATNTVMRKSSGPANMTRNSSESSLLNDQQKYDLAASFDSLSVRSSVSSNSRSWQAYLLAETEAANDGARSNMPVLQEHARLTFPPEAPSSASTVPSRYLKITGLSKTVDPLALREKFEAFGDLRGIYTREIALNGSIIIGYFDLRHAVTAYKSACSQPILGYHLRPQFFPKSYLVQMCESGIEMPFVSSTEGEVSIIFSGSSKRARLILENVLPSFGAVQCLKVESEACITCEFFDVRDSASAILNLDGQVMDEMRFYISYKDGDTLTKARPEFDFALPARQGLSLGQPDLLGAYDSGSVSSSGTLARARSVRESYSEPESPGGFCFGDRVGELAKAMRRHESYDYTKSKDSLDNYSQLDFVSGGRSRLAMPSPMPSPMTENAWDAEASLTFQVETYPDAMSRGFSVYTNATVPKNNVVDLERIARGLDTRTTLMLRNIPNKVDQQMLKDYIDVTNKGTYDFLYLRIDFLNKCNVGYAFISFTSPEAIITFAKARAGTKWNRFNSEKICDISYANI